MIELEDLVLKQLMTNEEFSRKVIPYLERELFDNNSCQDIFDLIKDFISKYNNCPNYEALCIELNNQKFNEIRFKNVTEKLQTVNELIDQVDTDWMFAKTETWAKDQKLMNAMKSSINIYKDPNKKGQMLDNLRNALGFSFDSSIGHDYLKDFELRYEYYHRKEFKIPFDVDWFNKATNGGVSRKTLNIFIAGINVGKAQPTSTIIPTPNGYKKFGDLKVGDKVYGVNGTSTTVTGIFPQGKKETYEVEFWDGRKTQVCGEHLWPIHMLNRPYKIMSTFDIINKLKFKKWKKALSVPLCDPINNDHQHFFISPYLMGILLGDGCFRSSTISISIFNKEIVDKVMKELPKNYILSRKKNSNDYYISLIGGKRNNPNLIKKELIKFNLYMKKSGDKFIPKEYLSGSINQRFELLNGLIDTDGYISKGGSIEYLTKSKQLADDITQLIYGLGGICKSKIIRKKYNGQNNKYYFLRIRFNLKAKKYIKLCSFKNQRINLIKPLKLTIKNIEKITEKECMCISVNAKDHLYLTNDYIVTHNTLTMCHFAASNLLTGHNVLYLTLEVSQEEIAKRIDANLLGIPMQDIDNIPQNIYQSKILNIRRKTTGNLVVKEYPTASANCQHFATLLKELELKKKFKPDIIYLDYLNLCASVRYGYKESSYIYVKGVAEELRGLAVEYNVPIITATQVNREGFKSSDFGMGETSESLGVPMTADSMFAIISTDDLKSLNQYKVKHLKSRYVNINQYPSWVIGVDYDTMKLYDVEINAQSNITNIKEHKKDVPLFDRTPSGMTFDDIEKELDK